MTLRELGTLPNLLSLVRVPLGLLVWLAPRSLPWVVTLLVLAGVSDMLDGYFARRAGASAESLGAWLDPACDKFFVVSTLAALWVSVGPPWWLAALALVREAIVLALLAVHWLHPGLRSIALPTRSLPLGKATTCAQFLLLLLVLAGATRWWLASAVLSAVLGVLAGAQYTGRAVMIVRFRT